MNVRELYNALSQRIPHELSCSWDNDGLMCCADDTKEVKRVLIALDITAPVVVEAIEGGYDLVVSHHPLIFSPLKALDPRDPVAKKVVDLLTHGISAFSFHTRLDAVEGGVNDVLAELLGLTQIRPLGVEAIGRVGYLPAPVTLSDFAALVKQATGAGCVQYTEGAGAPPVHCVALLGGSGASDVKEAMAAGADTYLTGELKHNNFADAAGSAMNLLAAGHFHTENPVCDRLRDMIGEILPTAEIVVTSSDSVHYI